MDLSHHQQELTRIARQQLAAGQVSDAVAFLITSLEYVLIDLVDHQFTYVGDDANTQAPGSLFNKVRRAREFLQRNSA